MFSLCFIELQQMSNKLEKLDLFKLPSIVFVQRMERWQVFWTQPVRGTNRTAPAPAHQRTPAPALPPPHTRMDRHPHTNPN